MSLRTYSSCRGIAKKQRENYLIWEEGKAPDLVIELTSKSTKREDQQKKRELYRDVLRVSEYFLFDPTEDYLKPPLQGFRLWMANTRRSSRWTAAFRAKCWDCTSSETARSFGFTIPCGIREF